jgi:hypothetical protein
MDPVFKPGDKSAGGTTDSMDSRSHSITETPDTSVIDPTPNYMQRTEFQ